MAISMSLELLILKTPAKHLELLNKLQVNIEKKQWRRARYRLAVLSNKARDIPDYVMLSNVLMRELKN